MICILGNAYYATSEFYVKFFEMGLHTANSISGEFSFGISGFYIKNGEIQHPISQMTMSGNIIDLFERIVDVSREVKFIYSHGSPAVLVDGLSIGGE